MEEALLNVALALLSLLAAAATYGLSKLTAKVRTETRKIQDETLREKIDDAIDDVEELTTKTVGCIEQTTAKDLRQAVKGGKAGRDELLALSKRAAQEITAQIKPEVQALITEQFGSWEDYLKKCIETKVLQIKNTEA